MSPSQSCENHQQLAPSPQMTQHRFALARHRCHLVRTAPSQLHPHFFFNTLNNIYSLALKQDKDTATLVAKLAEMMRYMLYKADEKWVLLKEETEFIRNYVDVEHIRYRAAITINLDMQGIDSQSRIAPMLLLPFIENAFKHGVEEEQQQGFVSIIICKTHKELTLEVQNSIATKTPQSGGIGLINVKKRLGILYPNRHHLDIQHNQKFYHVSLTLALK